MKDKIYFASDFHLGTDGRDSTEDREIKIVKWLESIKADCKELYLLGDIFDYWYEYREVIPK
nr:UDP-2,3-diacylglucosamine diphosphatase [Saprospiraceae bacterium]